MGSRAPAPGSGNVAAGSTWTATFSEPVRPQSVNDASVRVALAGGAALERTATLAADGRELAVTVTSAMQLPADVTVTLTSGIADLAGNPLTVPAVPWSLSLPSWLDLAGARSANPGNTGATLPSLAVDADGSAYVAWEEGDGSTTNVYVERWQGGAWQRVGGAISAVAGATAAHDPSLAVAADGSPVLAWDEFDGDVVNIYVDRWDGNAWRAIGEALSAVGGTTSVDAPSLALDAAGSPTVAWGEYDTGFSDHPIHVARWDGQSWQPVGGALAIDAGTSAFATDSSVILDEAGRPIVAWFESDDNQVGSIYVERWTGGAWQALGPAVSPRVGSTNAYSPSLAIDASGVPLVAWDEVRSADRELFVSRWSGSRWEIVGGAVTPAGSSGYSPSLALDVGGTPVVAWDQGDGAARTIRVARLAGNAWQRLGEALTADPDAPAAHWPSLSLDARGHPMVAWQEVVEGVSDVHVALLNGP